MKKIFGGFAIELLRLTLSSALIGAVIALYKYLVFLVIELSTTIFGSSSWFTLLYGLSIAIILAMFSYAILNSYKEVRGSGLNGLKEYFRCENKDIKWYISLPLMLLNSLITFFLGIPLGMEAPSTFIGAMAGYSFNDISRNKIDDIKLSMGAGFSSAFLSPIAGIFYPFEEQKVKINMINVLKAIYISFLSYYVSLAIHNRKLISIPLNETFDFTIWPIFFILIILTVIISLALMKGAKALEFLINKYQNKWFIKYRFFIVTLISLIILIFYPVIGGTGLGLIEHLKTHPAYYLVIIYLFARMILFLLGIYSTASGGAFGTAVTLGALVGYVSMIILSTFMDITTTQTIIVMAISSCAMFGAMNKAPLTACGLLITIAHYANFLNYAIAAIIIIFGTYFCMHILKAYPKEKLVK